MSDIILKNEDRVSDRLPTRSRISDVAQKSWFAVAYLLGFGGLYYFRYHLSAEKHLPWQEYYSEAWAVGVMIVFVIASLLHRGLTLRNDQTGDNVYYLGFLFTLTSLAMALAAFTRDMRTDAIVSSFGLALVATIAGIVLRIVVNGLRQDPVEIEDAARADLSTAARKLKAQLDNIVEELNSFSRETRQSVQDTLTELVTKTNETVSHSVEKLSDNSQRVIVRIDEAFKDFTDNSKRLNTISSKTVTAIEKLVERVNNIDAPSGMIVDTLQPLTAAVGELTGVLEDQSTALNKTLEHLKSTSHEFAEAGSSVRMSVGELAASIESIKSFTRSITEQQAQIVGSIEAIGSLKTSVQTLTGTIGSSVQSLPQVVEAELAVVRRHIASLEDELQRSREVTNRVHTALLETVQALKAAV